MIATDTVEIDWHKKDRYGRMVGKIMDQGQDVNLAMVQAGLAWWYAKYKKEQSPVDRLLYEDAEAKARTAKIGVWSLPDPTPPWAWRHRK